MFCISEHLISLLSSHNMYMGLNDKYGAVDNIYTLLYVFDHLLEVLVCLFVSSCCSNVFDSEPTSKLCFLSSHERLMHFYIFMEGKRARWS